MGSYRQYSPAHARSPKRSSRWATYNRQIDRSSKQGRVQIAPKREAEWCFYERTLGLTRFTPQNHQSPPPSVSVAVVVAAAVLPHVLCSDRLGRGAASAGIPGAGNFLDEGSWPQQLESSLINNTRKPEGLEVAAVATNRLIPSAPRVSRYGHTHPRLGNLLIPYSPP